MVRHRRPALEAGGGRRDGEACGVAVPVPTSSSALGPLPFGTRAADTSAVKRGARRGDARGLALRRSQRLMEEQL